MNIYIGNFKTQTIEKQFENPFTPLGDLLTVEITKEDHYAGSRVYGRIKVLN